MDWESFCIIDNKENKDITEDVINIDKDDAASRYKIRFYNNETTLFSYSLNRITYLKDPVAKDIGDQIVFVNGKIQSNIKAIIQFDSWCKLLYCDGQKRTVPYSSINFIKNIRNEQKISNIMDYLIEIAQLDECESDKEDEEGFLVSQLKSIPIREDSVLSMILKNEIPESREHNHPIIAPFTANSSQLKAIKNAFESRISIIQGPPGTGKTQTILNIISNLLVEGKTIAVVSGNNEATRNVYEKLDKENLGSICAFLGNKANIEQFFSSLPTKAKLLQLDLKSEKPPTEQELRSIESMVSKIYSSIAEKAKRKNLINELLIEQKANAFQPKIKNKKIAKKLDRNKKSISYLQSAAYIEALYSNPNHTVLGKLRMLFHFGFWPNAGFSPSEAIDFLQNRYYQKKIDELQSEIDMLEETLSDQTNLKALADYQRKSFDFLLHSLKKKFGNIKEKTYNAKGYRRDPSFLTQYPIVLSTTHSLHFCTPIDTLFDYIIIDESSQVNLTSASIALSCAKNAVIVGDSKQLPHIIPSKLKEPFDAIRSKYSLPSFIDYRRFNILECIIKAFGDKIPNTLLNEHYRCDPEIIGFCNKMFYDSNLIVQTQHQEKCGIRIIETPTHTCFGRTNPRQTEIICSEILPSGECIGDIGIVAPYRDQVTIIKNRLNRDDIIVDTVHKFQGKERETMILSTTSDRTVIHEDPEQIDFLNNPNLINVAISRAKKKLFVIATSEALQQERTLLCDFAKYASYYCKSTQLTKSEVYSVFDLMYDDYSPILQKMKEKMLRISTYDSENIVATLINDICKSRQFGLLSFKFNYPLRKIINLERITDIEDRNFILAPGTHCDFVIFNELNKRVILIVEVDGKQHEKTIQKQRDERKDRIITSSGLKLVRIKTTDLKAKEKIECKLP